jgi:hypothetical protein
MCRSPAIPQVMGPTDISNMSSTPSLNQTLTVLNLIADGSNWSTYSERVMNYLTSKGLKRHIQGTVRKPADLVKRKGEYYRQGTLSPLNDKELEKHKKEQDGYEQKQASICEVFYRTVDKSTFIQVKNETDAAAV